MKVKVQGKGQCEWAILGRDWIYEGVTIYYFPPQTPNIDKIYLGSAAIYYR